MPDDATALRVVAFGSCNGQTGPQEHWAAIRDSGAQLFLFLGDNVYGDRVNGEAVTDPGPSLDELSEAYAQLAAQPLWKDFYSAVPVLTTWDDHDYGLNDAGGTFAHRERAEQIYLDFWQIPAGDPRRARPGVHHAQTFGPPGQRVQIILLDTRSFRSDLTPRGEDLSGYRVSPEPDATLLGEAQWRWLTEQLQAPADLRIVASSIQLLSESHHWERWATMPAERARLLDLLASEGAGATLVLSGDRHLAGVYQLQHDGQTITEVTSSSLNVLFGTEFEDDPLRLGDANLARNFGLLHIDWEARAVAVTLHDEAGAPLPQALPTVPLAEL